MSLALDDAAKVSLPGRADAPGPAEVAARQGQLNALIDADAVLAVAAATVAASDADFVRSLHARVGLGHRPRQRRSPFALRAVLIALDDGRFAAHEDLRAMLPLAADQLVEPLNYKFGAFYQEAVVAGAHAASPKQSHWDVHHLWHASHGMFWYPDMPMGDLYAGARLNEAACEAHWYYIEGILQPRCAAHRERDHAVIEAAAWPDCPACDAASERRTGDEARIALREGLRFWDSEAASVDLFRETHRPAPNPLTGKIENWREGLEYARLHYRRLRSAPFRRYVETCLIAGLDYHSGYEAYRDAIAARLARLLLAPLTVDVGRARIRQARRVLQDVGARLSQAEHLGLVDRSLLDSTSAVLAELTPLARAAGPAAEGEVASAAASAWDVLLAIAAAPGTGAVLALGYDLRELLGPAPPAPVPPRIAGDGVSLTGLAARLEERLPRTLAAAAASGLDGVAVARRLLARPESFYRAERSLARQAIAALEDDYPALAELGRYEQILRRRASPGHRLREDLYARDPETLTVTDDLMVRVNPSLQPSRFAHAVDEMAAGRAAIARETVVWAGAVCGRGIVEVATELAPLAADLRRPRPFAELVAPSGPFAGRAELAADWLRRGLLIGIARRD